FDPKLPLVVCADASPYGVGAVLAHRLPDGSEQPICFASRTLNEAKRRYAQLHREALVIVFAVKKFFIYLSGAEFMIYTDHQPLLGIFNPSKPIPQIVSPRLLRW